ncbi:hypothetical protein PENSPDRAFT_652645, partial [Peniophora sp. CONT]
MRRMIRDPRIQIDTTRQVRKLGRKSWSRTRLNASASSEPNLNAEQATSFLDRRHNSESVVQLHRAEREATVAR